MCVILSAKVSYIWYIWYICREDWENTINIYNLQVPSNDDPTLADKEAILASLNIKAMTFDDTIGVLTQSKY